MMDMNHDEIRQQVLQELMEKMREMEGEKLRPKVMEASVTAVKPGMEEGSPEEEKMESPEAEHAEEDMGVGDSKIMADMNPGDGEGMPRKDEEDMSDDDMGVLERMFGHGG